VIFGEEGWRLDRLNDDWRQADRGDDVRVGERRRSRVAAPAAYRKASVALLCRWPAYNRLVGKPERDCGLLAKDRDVNVGKAWMVDEVRMRRDIVVHVTAVNAGN
jgi:hypothetical protein